MKPIGYRDLHGTKGGAYVFRLEPKQIGGIAIAAGAAAIILLLLGVLFAGSSSNPTTVVAAASPRRPVFTAVVTPAPSEREPQEATEGLAPQVATPVVEAPVARNRPAAQPKPSPARTPTRPAAVRPSATRPPAASPAASPAAWKPPTPYGFIVASFVVPTPAGAAESSALVTARRRGEAQVAALRKRGLTRARLVETRGSDRILYRVLADERRYYDRADAAERKADLRREHRFREVWVLPL